MKKFINKVIITTFILLIFYLGLNIQLPIDFEFSNIFGSNFEFLQILLGGNNKISFFMLGLSPYISINIVTSLLGNVSFLPFKRWSKNGLIGMKKLKIFNYIATFFIAIVQFFGLFRFVVDKNIYNIVNLMFLMFIVAFGSVVVAFLADRITQVGLGKGVSIFIMFNIILHSNKFNFDEIFFITFFTTLFIGILLLSIQGKIYIYSSQTVTYEKNHYIPIKALASNIMPIIVSSGLMTFINMFTHISIYDINGIIIYASLIFILTFAYNIVQLNPSDMAENLQQSMFLIPSVKPNDMERHIFKKIILMTFIGAPLLSIYSVIFIILINTHILPNEYLSFGVNMLLVLGATSEIIHDSILCFKSGNILLFKAKGIGGNIC